MQVGNGSVAGDIFTASALDHRNDSASVSVTAALSTPTEQLLSKDVLMAVTFSVTVIGCIANSIVLTVLILARRQSRPTCTSYIFCSRTEYSFN